MAIPVLRERLDNGSPDGCRVAGLAREVISPSNSGTTANVLTTGQSGALCLFDNAAGNIYTLPAITSHDLGMWFEFLVTVTRTSNAHSIDTDAATTFLGLGGIVMVGDGATVDHFAASATDVSIDLDSATTGQQIGGQIYVTAFSTTQWIVSGYAVGVGVMATPFA